MGNEIIYSPKAIEDLDEISNYISNEFKDVNAANNVVNRILSQISNLKEFPELGPELIFEDNIKSGHRFLICKRYIAIYHISNSKVMIDRILHEKRNYMQILRK